MRRQCDEPASLPALPLLLASGAEEKESLPWSGTRERGVHWPETGFRSPTPTPCPCEGVSECQCEDVSEPEPVHASSIARQAPSLLCERQSVLPAGPAEHRGKG